MDIKNIVSTIGDGVQIASVKNAAKPSQSVDVEERAEDNNQGNKIGDDRQESAEKPHRQEMDKAVSDINRFFQSEKRKLSFSINESTHDVIIEVKDIQTDEVIRQIPPEYVVKLAEHLHELSDESGESKMASGLLFKYKT